jgi:NAD(P)-dependent dehydrogenase (short-subunit alcohol dehydrogenase family)
MKTDKPKVALITGGNSGIGIAAARKLAASGFHMLLAARNEKKSIHAIEWIKAEVPGASVEWLPLDLASFAAVRECAAVFHAKGLPLHVLINHAGGSVPGKQASFSTDGFELTFATDHLGHFLLTNLLLEDLKRSAPARVITISSQLHIPGYANSPGAHFDYANLKGEKFYNRQAFYRNSKLANVWFAYELQRRLEGTGVTSNALCPGFVPESIAERRNAPLEYWLYTRLLSRMPFARSTEQAADSYLAAATDPRYATTGGVFIVDGKERRSSEESYDVEKARLLWERSLEWCGLA